MTPNLLQSLNKHIEHVCHALTVVCQQYVPCTHCSSHKGSAMRMNIEVPSRRETRAVYMDITVNPATLTFYKALLKFVILKIFRNDFKHLRG